MVEGLTATAPYQGFGACGREYIAHSTILNICGERPRSDVFGRRTLAPAETRVNSPQADWRPDAYDPGDSSGEATPVPIPNTEVKLSSAEDTERAAFREHRSSPGSLRFQGASFRSGAGSGPPRLSLLDMTTTSDPGPSLADGRGLVCPYLQVIVGQWRHATP